MMVCVSWGGCLFCACSPAGSWSLSHSLSPIHLDVMLVARVAGQDGVPSEIFFHQSLVLVKFLLPPHPPSLATLSIGQTVWGSNVGHTVSYDHRQAQ